MLLLLLLLLLLLPFCLNKKVNTLTYAVPPWARQDLDLREVVQHSYYLGCCRLRN
jgi:hypothetical protein